MKQGSSPPQHGVAATTLRALRPHQWAKNLLLGVPLVAAHQLTEPALLADLLLAFVAFSLCASSVYLVNDLLDLENDRQHPTKRHRPLASGALSPAQGKFWAGGLLAASLGGSAWLLPGSFALGLVGYYLVTLAYSLVLKRRIVLDVLTLAGLYTVRVIAGGLAVAIAPSFWLLALSMFLFMSLALVKRYAELFQAKAAGRAEPLDGRDYQADDLPMIASLGAASGFIAVLVLALYVNDGATSSLYGHPELIWLACPLLLAWVSRVWMLAHRGRMTEDPVLFALRDWPSLAIGGSMAVVFWAAS